MIDSNDDNDDRENAVKDFAETIADVLSHTLNEPALIQRIERYLSPRPANIFSSDDEGEELIRHIDKFLGKCGPREEQLIMIPKGKMPPSKRVRTYPLDITNELTASFHRCRSSVCRVHMFHITLDAVQTRPQWWTSMTEEDSQIYARTLSGFFWDTLEIATIRLASYWDRVGQLLDFVFFNIRQYERDGFPAVLERIKKNFAPTFSKVDRDPNWKALLEYANSEKPGGFKWLMRRRNLAVHSTRFRPHEDTRDTLFDYEFNH